MTQLKLTQSTVRTLQFRNGIYQGGSKNDMRHGFGILIIDDADIIISFWENNKVEGSYIYIGQNINAYGYMKQSNLIRFNVIQYNQLTIYGLFKNNLLHGKVLFRYKDFLSLYYFEQGKKTSSIQQYEYSNLKFIEIINKNFNKQIIGLTQYLSSVANSSEIMQKSSFRELQIESQQKYYGFTNKKGQGYGIGITLKMENLYSYGYFKNCKLNGLGRIYENNGQIYDGVFESNKMESPGIKYIKNINKFNINCVGQKSSTGYGFPRKQINRIRKIEHLKSQFFIDLIIVRKLLVNVDFKQIFDKYEDYLGYQKKFKTIKTKPNITKKEKSPFRNFQNDEILLKKSNFLENNSQSPSKLTRINDHMQNLQLADRSVRRLRFTQTRIQNLSPRKKYIDQKQSQHRFQRHDNSQHKRKQSLLQPDESIHQPQKLFSPSQKGRKQSFNKQATFQNVNENREKTKSLYSLNIQRQDVPKRIKSPFKQNTTMTSQLNFSPHKELQSPNNKSNIHKEKQTIKKLDLGKIYGEIGLFPKGKRNVF